MCQFLNFNTFNPISHRTAIFWDIILSAQVNNLTAVKKVVYFYCTFWNVLLNYWCFSILKLLSDLRENWKFLILISNLRFKPLHLHLIDYLIPGTNCNSIYISENASITNIRLTEHKCEFFLKKKKNVIFYPNLLFMFTIIIMYLILINSK